MAQGTALAGAGAPADLPGYEAIQWITDVAHKHRVQPTATQVPLTPTLRPLPTSTPARRRIDPDQAWFWTAQWQAGERAADSDLAAGRFTRYGGDDAFVGHLERVPPATEAEL